MIHPDLRLGAVHLWFADLSQPREVVRLLGGMLSAEEQAQARRFRRREDHRRYILSRGLLRLILGRYLALDGRELRFRYGPWGKPTVSAPRYGPQLQFNLSHSADGVLYAISTDQRVGVDMERIRPIPDGDDIACRFFPPEERQAYGSAQGARREEIFLRCWTRREALLKAVGRGWSGEDLTSDSAGRRHPRAWILRSFHPTPQYVAALAMEAEPSAIRCFAACPGGLPISLGLSAVTQRWWDHPAREGGLPAGRDHNATYGS